MGGSDSKDEKVDQEELAEQVIQLPKKKGKKSIESLSPRQHQSDIESPQNSPRRAAHKNPSRMKGKKTTKEIIKMNSAQELPESYNSIQLEEDKSRSPKGKKKRNQVQHSNSRSNAGDSRASYSQNSNIQYEEVTEEPTFFEHWQPRFHQEGQLRLKINVIEIQPTQKLRQLERKTSKHSGQLSWSYQGFEQGKQRKLCLRFILEEDDGFILNFLVDEDGEAVEGDQDIWNLICPFRTQEEVSKVGAYLCERIYEAEQEEQEGPQGHTNSKLFVDWQQKEPQGRMWMKELLQRRQKQYKMRNNIGFDYGQASKYFTSKNQWIYSVFIEEKNNKFKSYLIQHELQQEPNNKNNQLGQTLLNDIENRENLFVDEMRKKRSVMRKALKRERR